MELSEHHVRMDALVSRILELCESEGITVFELRMLSSRLGRAIPDEITKLEKRTPFRRTLEIEVKVNRDELIQDILEAIHGTAQEDHT